MIAHVSKPALLEQLQPGQPAVIEASAGTGKTYTLEHLVVELVIGGHAKLPELLVVTFTDKASSELKARLRKKLRQILDAPAGPPPEQGAYWAVGELERARLREALLSFDSATISTIHAFCQRILSDNAFSNLRMFSEQVVDAQAAFSQAFFDALRGPLATDPRLSPYLEAWLGRGETVHTLRDALFSAHVRRAHIDPEFAASEADGLLHSLRRLPFDLARMQSSLRRLRLPEGLTEAQLLQQLQALRSALTKAGSFAALLDSLSRPLPTDKHRRPSGARPSLLSALLKALDGARLRERDPLMQLREGLLRLRRIAPSLDSVVAQLFLPVVQGRLQTQKRRRGEYDFDDMMALVSEALDNNPRLAPLLRERYPYALIDEFQDTDELQWRVFRELYLHGHARGCLYVIGDPKQAIYGFRGADLRTYMEARAELLAAGGALLPLVNNYRSSPPLLAAVNQVLDQAAPEPFFTGEIRYDRPAQAAQAELLGVLEDGLPAPGVTLVELELGDAAERIQLPTAEQALATWIAEEAARILHPSRPSLRLLLASGPRVILPQEIFVLTRSRREGRLVLEALRNAQVPAEIYKEDGLFQTPEAEELLALLKAVADPGSRALRMAAWQTPFFGVSWAELPSCLDLPGSHPLMRSLFRLKELADARRYAQLFGAIREETGRVERGLLLEDSGRALTNTLHLLEVLEEEASDRRTPLSELNQRLSGYIQGILPVPGEEGNTQRMSAGRQAVQVMSMHQSKGLEASVVFLFGGLNAAQARGWLFHRASGAPIGSTPPAPATRGLGVAGGVRQLGLHSAGAQVPGQPGNPPPDAGVSGLEDGGGARQPRSPLAGAPGQPGNTPPDAGVSGLDGTAEERQPGLRATEPAPAGGPGLPAEAPPRQGRHQWIGDDPPEAAHREQAEEDQRLFYVALTRAKARLYLPLIPTDPGGEPLVNRMRGGYRAVNARLWRCLSAPASEPGFSRASARLPRGRGEQAPPAPVTAPLAWSPRATLCPQPGPDPRLLELRRQHFGPLLSSYSRIKAMRGGYHAPTAATAEAQLAPPGPDELPGGTGSGLLVHALLEEAPLAAPEPGESWQTWSQRPAITALGEAALRRFDREPRHWPHVAQMVFTALFQPLSLGDTRFPRGLGGADRVLRELEFTFPIHGPGGQERGLLRGFIDALVEQDGRLFVVDWKTDLLPDYRPAALAAHVAQNYAIQALLYSEAALRLLDVQDAAAYQARFGGAAYVFTRGLGDGAGLYFTRPSFTELRAAIEALKTAPLGPEQ